MEGSLILRSCHNRLVRGKGEIITDGSHCKDYHNNVGKRTRLLRMVLIDLFYSAQLLTKIFFYLNLKIIKMHT